MKHLDSEYRGRWEEFFLSDGSIKDSRAINWRDVEWEKVERILVHVKDGRVHEFIKKGKPNFKGFMNFRWGGKVAQFENDAYIGHKEINVWTVGWTDGEKHYLTDIDFFSGDIVKEYEAPYEEFFRHVHERL